MCGRYSLGNVNLKKRFGTLSETPEYDKSYNISPSSYNPVIIRNSQTKIVMMKWGFVPEWSKDPKFSLINIRKETIKDNKYFNNKLMSSRCLIPAYGFYEWKKIKLEKTEEKIPYFFHLDGRKIFSFAGIYTKREDVEGKLIYTYAIITCPPNGVMEKIHNRMPVILNEKDEDAWLDPERNDTNPECLLVPFFGRLKTYPVGRGVNNPANDDEGLLRKINVNSIQG